MTLTKVKCMGGIENGFGFLDKKRDVLFKWYDIKWDPLYIYIQLNFQLKGHCRKRTGNKVRCCMCYSYTVQWMCLGMQRQTHIHHTA